MKKLISAVLVLGVCAAPLAIMGCEEKPAANTPPAKAPEKAPEKPAEGGH